jgi:hypothetical protein
LYAFAEEHRRNIAAAIRAKWQNPEYRAKVIGGIHTHVEKKFGIEPGTSATSQRKRAREARARMQAGEAGADNVVSSRTSTAKPKASGSSKSRQPKGEAALAQVGQYLLARLLHHTTYPTALVIGVSSRFAGDMPASDPLQPVGHALMVPVT